MLSTWVRWFLLQLRFKLAHSYMALLVRFISTGALQSAHDQLLP